MKVLVTGATGFIGRHVVRALLKEGHAVLAFVRNPEKVRNHEWFEQVDVMCYDIHADQELSFNNTFLPEAVIHLAWPGLPNYSSLFHIENNLMADYRFIKSLVGLGISQITIAGTCLEYGMHSGSVSESCETNPTVPYAIAKDSLHKFLRSLQNEQPFTLQWARLFYMYGDGQGKSSLFSQLDAAIEQGAEEFNMSKGEQLRDYLPVEDVAKKLVGLMECTGANGTYNICSGTPVSIRRMVEDYIHQKSSEIKLNLGFYPYPDYEPMAFWGNSSKLDKLLSQNS